MGAKISDEKFGAAYEKLAADRKTADEALGAATEELNDSLAKQAALADTRFSKTVKDLSAASQEAAHQVSEFRKEFGNQIIVATSELEKTQQKLVDSIAKVSGEVISLKANQIRVNRRVDAELARVEKLSNDRHTESKTARGKLRQIMDENKEAAAAEVAELRGELKVKLQKARQQNEDNAKEMAADLTTATSAFYEKLSAQQKAQQKATGELNAATAAATAAAAADLKSAKEKFDSKIIELTNTVVANAKKAEEEMGALTGVVQDYAKASEADRQRIKDETKAVEKRIAEHLKNTKRYLQVELNHQVEEAADNVMKIIEGKRQKIADNYLSLKAYAVSAADDIQDYVTKGQGRG